MAKRVDVPVTGTMQKALPSLSQHLQAVTWFKDLLPSLQADLNRAERGGSTEFARAFLSLYALKTALDQATSAFNAVYEEVKETRIPASFERAGVSSVPLQEGYRVQTQETMYVSVKPGMRDAAMQWVREHVTSTKEGAQLADLIIETINASTLSAAGRFMLAEEGRDLPGEFFEATFKPTSSVNKVRSK